VTNRAYVHMRLRAFKLLFGHSGSPLKRLITLLTFQTSD
jgi:hypothetical protein